MSMDGAKASARRGAARKITYPCPCGRMVYGNGKAHQRCCPDHLRAYGWPLDEAMRDAVRDEYSGAVVRSVERGLGEIYLERISAGDKSPLAWRDLRDHVWRLAAKAGDPS